MCVTGKGAQLRLIDNIFYLEVGLRLRIHAKKTNGVKKTLLLPLCEPCLWRFCARFELCIVGAQGPFCAGFACIWSIAHFAGDKQRCAAYNRPKHSLGAVSIGFQLDWGVARFCVTLV